ncbi:hypothetical protein JW921_07325 [Candidatus Fermentibacterales bacterium]|nr:hypothetical protein [Candidatus Fermentibacterales bacterium]
MLRRGFSSLLPAALATLVLAGGGLAGTLEPWLRATAETDSLGLAPGRREIAAGLTASQGAWLLRLRDTYVSSDSGGMVPRGILAENDLEATLRFTAGPFYVRPGVRFRMEPGGTGIYSTLPGAVLGYRRSAASPSLRMGVQLPWSFDIDLYGRYASREYELDDTQEPIYWKEQLALASVSWRSPIGLGIGLAGFHRGSRSEDLDEYESDYNRLDIGVFTGPRTLPAIAQIMASAVYSLNDGLDHSDGELANRLVGHVRMVKAILPAASVSMDLKAFMDHSGDDFQLVGASGLARLGAQFLRGASVPSSASLSVHFTNNRFLTRRFEASTRVNIWRGICGTFAMDLRDGPTVSPIEPDDRQRVILKPGIEYILDTRLRLWVTFESERGDLSGIEEWSRVSGGLELSPGPLSI